MPLTTGRGQMTKKVSNTDVDLARQQECHLMKAGVLQLPKHNQIRAESKLFQVPSHCHLTFLSRW